MPTYVYRREDGTTFEAFQRISDPALAEDPETGKPVTRVISGGAGLQFKGSGFYLTDYVRKDSSSESADRKSQASGNAAEPKADPKPAAKADAKAGAKAGAKADATPAAAPKATPAAPKKD